MQWISDTFALVHTVQKYIYATIEIVVCLTYMFFNFLFKLEILKIDKTSHVVAELERKCFKGQCQGSLCIRAFRLGHCVFSLYTG